MHDAAFAHFDLHFDISFRHRGHSLCFDLGKADKMDVAYSLLANIHSCKDWVAGSTEEDLGDNSLKQNHLLAEEEGEGSEDWVGRCWG
jgi:hypothetical protein